MKVKRFPVLEDEQRRKKWAYLTEGAEEKLDNQNRLQVEVLLENQDRYNRMMTEAQTSMATNVGTVIPGSLGLVRRIFPKLVLQQLISVQPMDRPNGKVFFLDFKAGTTKGTIAKDTRVDQFGADGYDYATRALETDAVMDIYFDIANIDVTAEEKALKAKWTLRSQQDLMAYRGLNAETELMGVLGDEIIREIDIKGILMLLLGATAGNVNWSINVPAGSPWNVLDPDAYKKTLYHAIVDANNLIFKKRYRDAAWIVADTDSCGRIEKLENFKLEDSGDPAEKNIGIYLFGVLNHRWKVYKHPYQGIFANKMLLGYKGNEWYETGAVYAPYVPIYTTPVIIDPDDLTPRRGMMSRYALAMVVGDCFSTVTLVSS